MKVPAAALAALLLVAICSPAEAHSRRNAESSQKPDIFPTECCVSYSVRRIPSHFISSAYSTSSVCLRPAVVLVTKTGKRVCVSPEEAWVQEKLKELQMLKY